MTTPSPDWPAGVKSRRKPPCVKARESQCHFAKLYRQLVKDLRLELGDYGKGSLPQRVQQLMLEAATNRIKLQRIKEITL